MTDSGKKPVLLSSRTLVGDMTEYLKRLKSQKQEIQSKIDNLEEFLKLSPEAQEDKVYKLITNSKTGQKSKQPPFKCKLEGCESNIGKDCRYQGCEYYPSDFYRWHKSNNTNV